MLDNKWKHGKVHLELSQLPAILFAPPGIKAIPAVLDSSIGEETVLLLTEAKNEVSEFEGRNITRFTLKAGWVYTSYGPVLFFLFYFPNPITGNQVTYEISINPKDYKQLAIYERLSRQKYWHVVIADETGEVVNFFEFPNEYGLSETLQQVTSVCEKMQATDFMAAKAEYEIKYSVDQLLEM
jgi:hypothetical protein